jgi:hypothetical protein
MNCGSFLRPGVSLLIYVCSSASSSPASLRGEFRRRAQCLYANMSRGVRTLLEHRGMLSTRQKHKNGAAWIFWAQTGSGRKQEVGLIHRGKDLLSKRRTIMLKTISRDELKQRLIGKIGFCFSRPCPLRLIINAHADSILVCRLCANAPKQLYNDLNRA